jgi:small subunit ribosomal protein S1
LGDPWQDVATKYPVGSVVEGPVVSLADFGVFVSLEDGLDGMVHIADISAEKRIDHPKDVLKAGEVVKAKVLEIDTKRRRIRLGMKQLEPTAADRFIAEHAVGDEITGRVMEAGKGKGKVDLGEGVRASLILKEESAAAAPPQPERKDADIRALTSMLAARWKEGVSLAGQADEGPRAGEIRRFRIRILDPEQKKIEVELVL